MKLPTCSGRLSTEEAVYHCQRKIHHGPPCFVVYGQTIRFWGWWRR